MLLPSSWSWSQGAGRRPVWSFYSSPATFCIPHLTTRRTELVRPSVWLLPISTRWSRWMSQLIVLCNGALILPLPTPHTEELCGSIRVSIFSGKFKITWIAFPISGRWTPVLVACRPVRRASNPRCHAQINVLLVMKEANDASTTIRNLYWLERGHVQGGHLLIGQYVSSQFRLLPWWISTQESFTANRILRFESHTTTLQCVCGGHANLKFCLWQTKQRTRLSQSGNSSWIETSRHFHEHKTWLQGTSHERPDKNHRK